MADGLELGPLLAGYTRGLMPLKLTEPDPEAPGKLTLGLGDDLALLLTKVAPTISTEQADAWIKVAVTALSDLPGRVAREAAQAALHQPMRFANEIEGTVRAIAAELMVRHRMAYARISDMASEQRRQREAAGAEPPPLTDAEIRRMSADMRAMGLACGALTQERIDRALAAGRDEAAAMERNGIA